MKKQMVMAVMVLMFVMAEGCSKRTDASVGATEFVAEIQETEGEKQEVVESGSSEEPSSPESEKAAGPEITETEMESEEQGGSRENAVLESAAAVSTEDTETHAKADSEKRIPKVPAEVPKRASETSAALGESVRPSSPASQGPSPIVPETVPVSTSQPENRTEPEPAAETIGVAESETEAPPETEPKTAYDYPFDMDSIRSDCIGTGQGMGLALDSSLTPGNAAWWNPVTASQSNQGAGLKQSLKSYVSFHTPDNLAGYGMDEITVFNIYCEPRGNGEYSVYFLFG